MKTRTDQARVETLHELVAALDRRAPRVERDAERQIAHEARRMRCAALKRIAELGGLPASAPLSGACDGRT